MPVYWQESSGACLRVVSLLWGMLFQALAGREGCTTLPALISMARAPFISAVRNGAQENVAGHKLWPS